MNDTRPAQPFIHREFSPAFPCDGTTLSLESLVLQLRWPHGGCVWNYPLAVHATRDGATRRIPIVDVTRLAQWTLWALALLAGVIALAAHRRSKGDSHE